MEDNKTGGEDGGILGRGDVENGEISKTRRVYGGNIIRGLRRER